MMRTLVATVLVLASPSMLAAGVIVRPADSSPTGRRGASPSAPGLPGELSGAGVSTVAAKADEPAETLFVPFFEVDTTDPTGTTTLLAVRNGLSTTLDVEIRYRSSRDEPLGTDRVELAGHATVTQNLRDVEGLPTDASGVARGYVEVALVDAPRGLPGPPLVGDYLQVDVDDNFATGDRMLSFADFCEEQEIRFLDFGSGTELRFLIRNPRGLDPDTDPPSARVEIFAEDGALLDEHNIYTDLKAFALPASELTDAQFGTMVFDFIHSGGGTIYGEYSADGRFSVGLNSACRVFSSL